MEKQIDIIRKKCESKGLSIYDVFREAKIPTVTIGNWKRKEPDAFETIRKVNEAILELEKQKSVK